MQTTLEEVAILEEITTLADKLSPNDKIKLVKHLAESLENVPLERKKPRDLRGSWKVELPEGFEVEKEIREIRDEWKKKFSEFDE